VSGDHGSDRIITRDLESGALTEERTICVVCAWRKDCLKKFSFQSSGGRRCPDYTRDLTIKSPEDKEEKES